MSRNGVGRSCPFCTMRTRPSCSSAKMRALSPGTAPTQLGRTRPPATSVDCSVWACRAEARKRDARATEWMRMVCGRRGGAVRTSLTRAPDFGKGSSEAPAQRELRQPGRIGAREGAAGHEAAEDEVEVPARIGAEAEHEVGLLAEPA